MIRYTPSGERNLSLFQTPFEQSLSATNRWVRMAELVPWDKMAKVFFEHLSEQHGRPTVDLRVILGALMVKHIEALSDEDTIQYIQENIYAQYFVGLSSFQTAPVFAPSLFVEIRKRLGHKGSARLNDLMIKQARQVKVIKHRRKPSDGAAPQEDQGEKDDKVSGDISSQEIDNQQDNTPDQEEAKSKMVANQGTLIVDATVAPLHIAYPTDTGLLNHAREHSEQLIDRLFERNPELWPSKPRTYRRTAKRDFVAFNKKRKKTPKDIRKATAQQLRYVRRNIKTLHKMLDCLEHRGLEVVWDQYQWRTFWIIQELYRQQDAMYRDKRRRIDDRIVSIQQPHARPIKRGKGGRKDTEFGPKINVSITEGIARVDQIDFSAFNESTFLLEQIEAYRALFGYYPATVLADKIYWTRKNRKLLKTKGIEIGGVPLGRKAQQSKYEKQKDRKRNNKRSEIEGKFGQAKSKYSLDKVMTRLPDTIQAQINLIFLAVNLIKVAQATFLSVYQVILALHQGWQWPSRALSALGDTEIVNGHILNYKTLLTRIANGWNKSILGATF
jgi:IS5 family transposase